MVKYTKNLQNKQSKVRQVYFLIGSFYYIPFNDCEMIHSILFSIFLYLFSCHTIHDMRSVDLFKNKTNVVFILFLFLKHSFLSCCGACGRQRIRTSERCYTLSAFQADAIDQLCQPSGLLEETSIVVFPFFFRYRN